MGQKKALFYKYWILTKKQKMAFFCQIITPLVCLGLVKIIIFIMEGVHLKVEGFNGSSVFPSNFYPANLLTPKWEPFFNSFFEISNPIRLNRWTTEDPAIKEAFSFWIKHQPSLFSYEVSKNLIGNLKYPRWVFDEHSSNKGMNKELIQDLKYLNSLEKSELQHQERLPDSVSKIKALSQDRGVDVHLQINNLLYWRYHRKNGDQIQRVYVEQGSKSLQFGKKKISLNGKKSKKGKKKKGEFQNGHFVLATESTIAHMNMFTNLHLQSIFQNDLNNIISLISPTVDSNSLKDIIRILISTICTALFPIALSLGLPIMLFVLVLEKEEKIKDLLQVNGLIEVNYWFGFLSWNFFILSLGTGVFMLVGYNYISISFFSKGSMVIMFWFLSAWNFSQIGFSLFISSFITKSTTGTLAGYFFSIFLILFIGMQSQFLFPNPSMLPWFFYLLPQTPFIRYFYISISRCIEERCLVGLKDIMEGEMRYVFLSIHLTGVAYFFGGLILNEPKWRTYTIMKLKFLGSKVGLYSVRRGVGLGKGKIEIQDTFEGGRSIMSSTGEYEMGQQSTSPEKDLSLSSKSTLDDEEEFSDLVHMSAVAYQKKVRQLKGLDFEDYILVAQNLTKSYKCTQGLKYALRNFSIKLRKNTIFGLIGPNGAGKTTFLSIVTGINRCDSGLGWICGRNINDRIKNSGEIGFCPQFDILWPSMNVLQHLIFMGMFKGMTKSEAKMNAKQLIRQVDLEEDWMKEAGQLSGGMKRRLSLAMALTGQPKIIFLDEPSSGLDPVKRRHFWSLIKKLTNKRAVLMTTHLMEEADTLCNEIGILCSGKLRCYGNSLSLKAEFTEGIKLQIVLKQSCKVSFGEFVSSLQNYGIKAKLESHFKTTLNLVVDEKQTSLSTIFRGMTEEKFRSEIEDWSISLGSLEDVFLNVVKKYRESNIVKMEESII